MDIPLLRDVVLILTLAVIVLLVFRKMRIPSVLAFFVTGMLAGPHGLGVVSSMGEVQLLAELGVIFLLFTIGIEFSLEKFSQIRRYVIIGGSLQLTLTLAAVYFICLNLGFTSNESIFMGFLVSFSSTAIVLRLLQDNNEIDSVHGQIALGILIFQDIAVVLVILFTPMLAGVNSGTLNNWPLLVAEGVGLLLFTLISTKWVVPTLLHYMSRFKSRELFLLTVILICFGVTLITSLIGLSMALGAFLAGLIISHTDYSHQALGNIQPFQDIFMSFFFVSIGMLLDLSFIAENLLLIIAATIVILTLKSLVAGLTTGLMGLPFRVTVLVGLILSQIGEFSFILSATGLELGIISENIFQIFLSVSLITMSVTPFIMAIAPRISDFSDNLPLPHRFRHGFYPMKLPEETVWNDHLIIVGFGVNGKNVAKAAHKADIPYVVVEMNPEIVRNEKSEGESIYFGDAAHATVLKNINVQEARTMVVAISDPLGTRKVIGTAKKLNPNLYIIVRTRYIKEMEKLHEVGADEVIPEEFETSIEIFSRVLDQYNLSPEKIDEFIAEIRSGSYQMFRTLSKDDALTCTLNNGLNDVEVISTELGNDMNGKTVKEFLEGNDGELMAIIRGSETFNNPSIDFKLRKNDIIVISRGK
ncbi:MAG TPA: potassium transporter KefB [Methanobacterium subterraneum]|uniref:Potassium transporter KefB n=1 Tax=Methanobacterium subterraneum TaxID=59277 RepID=A0A7J4TLH4_9EURY|nr:potassium transporter KefB [Methanobacterium subterraneum]